jgi:hypothetical protein
MAPEDDRFQRWQKIAIDQLTYGLNLILVLATATLGYWSSLLRDDKFVLGPSAKCAMLLSLWALALSVGSGLLCVLNRLWDFRGTARRARNHPEAPTKDELEGLGRVTWWLFYFQWATFAVGVVALGTALLLTCGKNWFEKGEFRPRRTHISPSIFIIHSRNEEDT